MLTTYRKLQLVLYLTITLFLTCTAVDNEREEWHGKYAQVFPGNIRGPKRLTDRIGIIGAGPSGIHMAYLLKEKGFKNIEILEATFDLGGKSKTIDYRGAIHEMGTCYLSADYEQNILRLVKTFTSGGTKPPPLASVWSRITPSGKRFSFFYALMLKFAHPTKNRMELQQLLLVKITKYVHLHRRLFGDYYGELMPEPNSTVKHLIRGTFMEFLKRNDLAELQELFIASFTIQGYGNLREVPALYGLMWNTPRLVLSLVELASGKPGAIYMLQDGFQNLWRNIVERHQLKIMYGTRAKYIRLHYDNRKHEVKSVIVYFTQRVKGKNSVRLRSKEYDFLIWTPPADSFLRVVSSRREMDQEKELFSRMVNSYYATSLVDDVGAKRAKSAVNWWYDNIQSSRDMSVWANRDSYTMFYNLNGANYSHAMTITGNDGHRDTRTSVFYQYSHVKPSKKDLAAELTSHLKNLGASSVKILKQFPWRYFTRFPAKQAELGYHWRVLEIQGKQNIWFAGSSVSFESVKSVVEYNQLLVDRMIEPVRNGTHMK